jgi:xylulokinase
MIAARMAIYLGIDIGTSGTKALAVSAVGKILADATSLYPSHHPRPLWSEQDPEDWWKATVRTVRAVMKKSKAKPADVKAIGLSGQMHGSVFLDKAGKVIRRAILWNDQRTSAECAEIERSAGGRHKLIAMVANPALTGFTAPKILWLRKHEPRHFERTAKVLLPKDEVRRRLTGEFATDVSDASGMLLLDVACRQWSRPLLEKLELDAELLARPYESDEATGSLTKAAARTLGLTTECIVVAGAGDCAAGAVGNGIVRQGILSTSIGTSGVVFVHSDEVKVDPQGRLHTFCHAVRGKWHMMGVSLAAGGSLQWFRNALCQAEMAKARRQKIDPYELLTQDAAGISAGSEGLFFLPYLAGERTPHADPHARGCFVGLTLKHTRAHMVRAILEGAVYALQDSLQIIRALGVPVREVRASGGGSRSRLWRQIQADVFGEPVQSMAADEGPAYGAALLAAVGAGSFRSIEQACAATVRTSGHTRVDRKARAHYARAFLVYQGLYRSLKDDFERIAELG